MDVGLVARHVAEVGQEDVVGALLEHVLDRAVGDLGGEAVGALGPRDPFVVDLLREEGPNAQGVEEPGVEGIERVHREALRDADHVVALGGEVGGIGSRADVEQVRALLHPVVDEDIGLLLAHVGVLVAAPAEHVLRALHVQHLDGAEVLAGLAREYALVDDLARADLGEVEGLPCRGGRRRASASRAGRRRSSPSAQGSGGTRIGLPRSIAKARGTALFLATPP